MGDESFWSVPEINDRTADRREQTCTVKSFKDKKKYLTLVTHAAFLIDVFCKQNYSISFSCYIRKLIYVNIVFCLCIKFSNVFIYILNYSLHLHAHVNFLPFNHKVFVTIDDIFSSLNPTQGWKFGIFSYLSNLKTLYVYTYFDSN